MAAVDRREALAAAAMRVMARDGLAAGTTRAIVAEAGMSLASFHYAFGSRDELLQELVHRMVGRERRATTVEVHPDEPPAEALRRAAHGYLAHLLADPGDELFVLELAVLAARDERWAGLVAGQHAENRRMAADVLIEVARVCGVGWRHPVPDLARLLVAVLDGVTATWLLDRDTAAARDALDAGVDLFVQAHLDPAP